MKPRGLLLALFLAAAAPLHGEIYVTPAVGAAFGGNTDDGKITYVGTLAFARGDEILGFAIDFGYTPDFLGTTGFGNNNVTSLMANVMLISSGHRRIYASGGLGLMKTRVEDVRRLFHVDSNELGVNVGGGLMFVPRGPVGLQLDLRYFRNLTDPESDAEFDVQLGGLDYWRATAGVLLRF